MRHTLATAKALADEWADQKAQQNEVAALADYFGDAEPDDLIRMWETGHNMKGGRLTAFEAQALGEAWCRVFGSLPPKE